MENKEKNSVSELMETTMTKIREMVDSNSVIGEPITTPDGVTLIPVSRVSLGFGSGGGTYGQTSERFGGGGGAGVLHGTAHGTAGEHADERAMALARVVGVALERSVEVGLDVGVIGLVAEERTQVGVEIAGVLAQKRCE